MASTSTSISSPFVPCTPFSSTHKVNKRPCTLTQPKSSASTIICGSRKEAHDKNYYHGGRSSVDENMIVLRKRIHEMKMIERNYEPPANWMDWEKNCYVGYDEFICEAMGLLQSLLMNTRPSLALGITALLALSMTTSTTLVLLHLMEITMGVAAGVHLG